MHLTWLPHSKFRDENGLVRFYPDPWSGILTFRFIFLNQYVCDLALWITSTTSRFRPLGVPSVCMCYRSLKHKCRLTISASSCAIRQYVVLLFEGQVPPHHFGLFVCNQYVRGLALWRTSATSRFWPLRVPSESTWTHSLKDTCHLTILASSCAIRK